MTTPMHKQPPARGRFDQLIDEPGVPARNREHAAVTTRIAGPKVCAICGLPIVMVRHDPLRRVVFRHKEGN